MKRIIYLLILFGAVFCAGCQDVTVGYLMADDAGYQVDSLYVYNIEKRLKETQDVLSAFYEETSDMQEELAELNAIYEEAYNKREDFYWDEIYPLEEEMASLDPDIDAERIAEIQEKIDELDEIYIELDDAVLYAEDDVFAKQQEINDVAEEMGIVSLSKLERDVESLANRIKYKLPWATPPMESILGTEPLVYSIVAVTNEANPAAAEQFMKFVSVVGGGKLYLEQNVDAPDGRYAVSLRVENEGYSVVLENVFTFILESDTEIE